MIKIAAINIFFLKPYFDIFHLHFCILNQKTFNFCFQCDEMRELARKAIGLGNTDHNVSVVSIFSIQTFLNDFFLINRVHIMPNSSFIESELLSVMKAPLSCIPDRDFHEPDRG